VSASVAGPVTASSASSGAQSGARQPAHPANKPAQAPGQTALRGRAIPGGSDPSPVSGSGLAPAAHGHESPYPAVGAGVLGLSLIALFAIGGITGLRRRRATASLSD
jgi:hypothetical protein